MSTVEESRGKRDRHVRHEDREWEGGDYRRHERGKEREVKRGENRRHERAVERPEWRTRAR